MNDDLVCSLDEKHLSNMRVVDLKQELEKRGLSKSGSKKDLVKRLKQQLQFEKLCEGATSVKDNDSKLDLDEATEQNEFVQRYLAEKQKIYAEHKEAQRLIELREQQDSASSANEDVAEESDIVEINSSACEVSILSSSISTEQDVSVDDHCIPESSSIEEDSSIKDDNDVSKSVELDSSEENYHFVKEKSNLQSTEIHNKECSVSSVKVSCDGDSIKGEVKIRMKIHSIDSEHPLDINTKICENIAEELNLTNASGNSRSNWDQFESNLPPSDIESAHHISMEYSLSDIQLPDAPGGKKAENKMTDKVASNDVNRSSTNGEENTTLEISDMEVDLPEKQCENLNLTKSNVCESDNQVGKKIYKTDPETSVTGELLEVLSKSKNTDSGSSLEKAIEQEVSVEKNKSIEIQMSVTECEIIEDCLTKDNGQTPEISLEVPNKTIASKNELDMQCEKANALSTDKKCNKLSISKSEKLNKEDEKNLEKIVIHDPKSSLQYSCTSEDQSKDNVGGVHGTEKSVHKRKNHRTRHSSSHSSSSDSSSSERVFRSLEEPAKANPADLAPPSPASLQSKSRSESPQSDNKSTTDPVQKVLNISVPTEKRRLKINRNTVIKTEPNESLVKGEPMEVVLAEKSIGSVNFSGPIKSIDSTVEKDVGCSEEPMQAPESSRVIKFTRRKITIVSQKTNNAAEKSCESNPSTKRRKWGNCAAALSRGSLSISSDSLKNLIPDVKPFVDVQMSLDPDDHSPPVSSEMPSPSRKEPKPFNIPLVEDSVNDVITEKISNSGVKDSSLITSEVACSPPHNPTSSILFITNLVRPFTLLQLKDLLKQTGNIIEENFWIDKIKSKCFVMYETEEQAVRTRAALHDLRWPSSNPKILSVDFATQEELDAHKNGSENPKPVLPTLPPVMERLETRKYPVSEPPKKRDREDRKKEKERHRTTATHVREWDKDKLTQDSPERVPSQQSEKDGEKNRNSEKKKEKKESKRRQEEDAPAKLLDDLFRKTKASPCIYWLPLTEEQARKREEERQARRLERERRWLQQREQEEAERKSRIKNRSGRDKENRRTPSRSRSPVGRRR